MIQRSSNQAGTPNEATDGNGAPGLLTMILYSGRWVLAFKSHPALDRA